MNNRAKLIRHAFENSVDVLGLASKLALIEDLEKHGINLDNVNVVQLEEALRKILGNEATDLLIERFRLKLDELERYEE